MPSKEFKWLEIRYNVFVDGKDTSMGIISLQQLLPSKENKTDVIASITATYQARYPNNKVTFEWKETFTNDDYITIEPGDLDYKHRQ